MLTAVIVAIGLIYAVICGVTFLARMSIDDDEVMSWAAGVLWPIYLPYRLALMMWKGEV